MDVVATKSSDIRCTVEVREDTNWNSPGHLFGELLTSGVEARDRAERFAGGSLSWPEDGVILNLSLDRKQPVMRIVPEVRWGSIVIDQPLPDTARGRDAATMIRNGTLRGLSVEFFAQKEGKVGGVREIREARLLAAALVDSGAYGDKVEVRGAETQSQRKVAWL